MIIALLDAELRRDEGVRYAQYLDTKGIPTIGVGHNLNAMPLPDGWTQPITDDEVDILLNQDLQVVFNALDLHLPWWRQLDEVRQRVIANMTFNMGITTLLEFKNTLHAMQIGDYASAAGGMAASAWAREVGHRAGRLIEAMSTGVMPDEPQI
jgi:lysozyme